MASRLIMGVDPGLTRCGVGVVEELPRRGVAFVFGDTIRADKELSLEVRIQFVANEIERLILEYKPEAIALERVFAQANLRSVMGVAQISGVVLYLAARHQIPIHMHTPSEVKAAVTGHGRAAQPQIASAVQKILKLAAPPTPADTADALAIAITQSWRPSTGESAALRKTKAQEAWLAAERASKASRKG